MHATNDQHTLDDGRHDFDFLMGHWQVSNRRLDKPLQADAVWQEFEATNDARPLLDGAGNVDEFRAEAWRPGFIGMSLRLFNPETKQWSIYWTTNRSGSFEPPVVGCFDNGIGIFEGDDCYNGEPIRVRYTWTVTDRERPRWEQAFSQDGGKTWQTNWIMQFHRPPATGAAR